MLNIVAYSRHQETQPNVRIRHLETSEALPEPVLIGRRDFVDALRPGLWEEVRGRLEGIHRTEEGRGCLTFWREEQFIRPNEDAFESLLSQRMEEFPITVLEKHARVHHP